MRDLLKQSFALVGIIKALRQIPFDVRRALWCLGRAGDIRASRNALPGDFTRIIRLIEDGQIDTRPWITHQASFEEMIGVFPSWTQPETGVIKAVVAVD